MMVIYENIYNSWFNFFIFLHLFTLHLITEFKVLINFDMFGLSHTHLKSQNDSIKVRNVTIFKIDSRITDLASFYQNILVNLGDLSKKWFLGDSNPILNHGMASFPIHQALSTLLYLWHKNNIYLK